MVADTGGLGWEVRCVPSTYRSATLGGLYGGGFGGVGINNPHVYIVEDGKQGQVNPAVVATKLRFDPAGLLNPGKLRGWDQRGQILFDSANTAAHKEAWAPPPPPVDL